MATPCTMTSRPSRQHWMPVPKAEWASTASVKRHYATARIISAERNVFHIKGNSYLRVAAVDFEKAIVFINWIGTHADYDKIDVRTVQHGDW